jgi:DNA-binding transcriptional MocR family regulator
MPISSTALPSIRRCSTRSAKATSRCANGWSARWASSAFPAASTTSSSSSGSQQGLDYLGKLFLSPNDTALVTWPTYLGALQAFNAYEPAYDQLTPRAATARPILSCAGGRGRRQGEVRLSGRPISPTRPAKRVDLAGREKLIDLANEMDIAIIEDAAYQSLRYDGESVPPILALEIAQKGDIEHTRTIYCGSFSKTLAPGLRVGFIVANAPCHSQTGADEAGGGPALLDDQPDGRSHEVARKASMRRSPRSRLPTASVATCMLAALARHMPEGVTGPSRKAACSSG